MKFIFVLIVFAFGSLHAQELQFELGKKMKELPYGSYKFFNRTLARTYVVRTTDNARVAVAERYINYNPPFIKFAWESFAGKENKILEGFFSVGAKNYIVYSEFVRKTGVQNVYAQELSDDMVILGSPVTIATFRDVKNENRIIELGEKYVPYSNVRLIKSLNSNNLVILKIRDEKIDAVAFNPETGIIWSQAFEVNSENEVNVNSVEITPGGDLYMVGSFSREQLMGGSDVALGAFMLCYSASQKKYKVHSLDDKDKIKDRGYNLSRLRNGTVIAAGMYYNKKTEKAGYKIFSFDSTLLNVIPLASADFSEAFTQSINQGLYDIDYFTTTDVEQLDNGTIILAFAGGLSRSGKYTTTSFSTPVNVIAVTEMGEQRWASLLYKYQTQPMNDNYLGHSLVIKENLVFIFYNDHISNINLDPTKKPKEWILKEKNTLVTAVRIDEQGVARKTYPFGNGKAQKVIMDNEETRKIENGLYYFVFTSGELGQLATLRTKP